MKKRVGLILVGVVVFATGAWLWPRQNVQRLPGGIAIELYAVTSGTNHAVNLGAGWRSSLRGVLPTSLARRIRPRISGQIITASNTLAAWFKTDVDPSHSGKPINSGSRYECTLVDANGTRLAADSLNEVLGPSLHGDGRRLHHAVFPAPPEGNLTLWIQQRVVNADGAITFRKPVPADAGLSGAHLKTNEIIRFNIPNRGG